MCFSFPGIVAYILVFNIDIFNIGIFQMVHVLTEIVLTVMIVFFRLSNTQECLESSLIEKENTLAKTSEKLELISSLRESLSEKEIQYKEVSDKLLQTEHTVRHTFVCLFLFITLPYLAIVHFVVVSFFAA